MYINEGNSYFLIFLRYYVEVKVDIISLCFQSSPLVDSILRTDRLLRCLLVWQVLRNMNVLQIEAMCEMTT